VTCSHAAAVDEEPWPESKIVKTPERTEVEPLSFFCSSGAEEEARAASPWRGDGDDDDDGGVAPFSGKLVIT